MKNNTKTTFSSKKVFKLLTITTGYGIITITKIVHKRFYIKSLYIPLTERVDSYAKTRYNSTAKANELCPFSISFMFIEAYSMG